MLKLTLFSLSFLIVNQALLMGALPLYVLMATSLMSTLLYPLTQGGWCFFDSLSGVLTILTTWVTGLTVMTSTCQQNHKWLTGLLVFLALVLTLSFSVSNYFMMYVFFELALIIMVMMIMGWGYQPERVPSSWYVFLYTLFASVPLLVMIIYLSGQCGTPGFHSGPSTDTGPLFSLTSQTSLIIAFLVKLPVYLFHSWLPKAHVEAPVVGSMLLASVLLKLGGYGIIRVSPTLASSDHSATFFFVFIWGGGLLSIGCLMMMDVKLLVAYSSVVHMSMLAPGLILNCQWGVEGSTIIMLSHGLSSSGLFFMVNLMYERTHSRSISLTKGLISSLPVLSSFLFFLVVSNFGGPFMLSLIGECLLINSLVSFSGLLMIPLGVMGFFSAAYSLILYSSTQHSNSAKLLGSAASVKSREQLLCLSHAFPLVATCLSPINF